MYSSRPLLIDGSSLTGRFFSKEYNITKDVMAIDGESKLTRLEHQVQYLTEKLTEVLEGGV